VDILYPTATTTATHSMDFANFGEKPFKFDVATQLLGLELN
jgi:hypothetical protein